MNLSNYGLLPKKTWIGKLYYKYVTKKYFKNFTIYGTAGTGKECSVYDVWFEKYNKDKMNE